MRHVCKCVITTCNQYMLRGARAQFALVSMCARSGCQEFCLEREVNCSILLGQTFLMKIRLMRFVTIESM